MHLLRFTFDISPVCFFSAISVVKFYFKLKKTAERGVDNCAYCDEYECEKLSGVFRTYPNAKPSLDTIRNNI